MSNKKSNVSNIYQLNGRVPLLKAIPFGIQHILAMFVANLTPITIIAAAGGLPQDEIAVLLFLYFPLQVVRNLFYHHIIP